MDIYMYDLILLKTIPSLVLPLITRHNGSLLRVGGSKDTRRRNHVYWMGGVKCFIMYANKIRRKMSANGTLIDDPWGAKFAQIGGKSDSSIARIVELCYFSCIRMCEIRVRRNFLGDGKFSFHLDRVYFYCIG